MRKFNHLLRLEKLAQELIEGSFDRMLGAGSTAGKIAGRLAKAMEESELEGLAANSYIVRTSPEEFDSVLGANSHLETMLADYLTRLAREGGLVLAGQPAVKLIADENLTRPRILIEARQSGQTSDLTKSRPIMRHAARQTTGATTETYLIIYGKQHVPLEGAVVNLGRQLDNDVVVEDPTVSRRHAQLQWRHGHYVIFDLGSRAGTLVNGQRVAECVLQAGDVMTLGNVSIIYGEEQRGEKSSLGSIKPGHDDTQPFHYDDQT
jgi:hypothetical protein